MLIVVSGVSSADRHTHPRLIAVVRAPSQSSRPYQLGAGVGPSRPTGGKARSSEKTALIQYIGGIRVGSSRRASPHERSLIDQLSTAYALLRSRKTPRA